MARRRAGLTQQELAERSGHPRESIVRWENGAREPSLSTLQAVVAACGLELTLSLTTLDASADGVVADQLALSPRQRLEAVMPAPGWQPALKALGWLARARTAAVVTGDIAAALQGSPQQPASPGVWFVSKHPAATERELAADGGLAQDASDGDGDGPGESWRLPGGGTLVLNRVASGPGDFADLRRDAVDVRLDDGVMVRVAHPLDLLRLAGGSSNPSERARAPALASLLSALVAPRSAE